PAVLAMDPDVLLLDEPTAGLDDSAVRRLAGVISATGKTLIIVSHDARLLADAATSRCALRRGRIEPLAPGF
ncbi:MAG: ABC transporter ATP-binding protein, partial [Planctomycetia bacterium]|nr:ABC transporter ATP-binding protein [Planctomycetia bacterium]